MKKTCKYCKGKGILTKRMYDKIVREKFKKAEQAQKEGRMPSVWLPLAKAPSIFDKSGRKGKGKRFTYYCDQCDWSLRGMRK